MTAPKRLPKEGERIRIKVEDKHGLIWTWANVTERPDATGWFPCEHGDGFYDWRCSRRLADEGKDWRFPEDDPEVCAERPAVKDAP